MKTILIIIQIIQIIWKFAKGVNQFRMNNPNTFDKYFRGLLSSLSIFTASLLMYWALILYAAYFINHIEKPILLTIPTGIFVFAIMYHKDAQRVYKGA